jgi:periplasmic protein CpxP/Spy
MRLSRSVLLTLIGLALGAGMTLVIPRVLTLKQPTIAREDDPLLLATMAEASAQPTAKQVRPGKRSGLFQQLNLTPEQRQKLKEVRKQYQGQIRDRQRRAQQAQREMRSLLVGSASGETVRAKFSEFQQMQQAAAKLRFESILAMREVLTPAQRKQLAAQMEKNQQQNRRRQGFAGNP